MAQVADGVRTEYVLDVATPLTMVLGETTDPGGPEEASLYYLHGLDLAAQGDGTTTEYFAYDGLGSVRQVLSDAGSPLLTQAFDPYGNAYASMGTAASAFGFTGEQTDTNGLLYLRARYYAPGMGRFFQVDPSRQEVNPYLYAGSNPILNTDATGLSHCGLWPIDCEDENNLEYDTHDSYVVGFNLTVPYDILLNPCNLSPAQRDYWNGALNQILWDMTWPVHTEAGWHTDTIRLMVYLTVNGLTSNQLPDALTSGYLSAWINSSPSEFDRLYWNGSADYRRGRDAGRVVTTIWGGLEIGLGIVDALAFGSKIGPTGEATAVACAASVTGGGVLVCGLGITALTVEIGMTALGGAAVVHGAGMLLYIAGHPPGNSGAGDSSGDGETRRSEHAEERASQGRPVGQALQDAQNASKSNVYIQAEDGRWVVRGPNSREHIFEPDGELVTSFNRSNRAHQARLRNGTIRPISWDEFELFGEIFK